MNENPVILPPGCARFEMNPWPTGSTAIATTIGIVRVAGRRAATTALECATITSGASLITSATCLFIDSSLVPANRYSIWTLRPSTHPRSRMPNRNALTRLFVSGSFSSRPCCKRRCGSRAAEKADELASFHGHPEAKTANGINTHVYRGRGWGCPLWVTSGHMQRKTACPLYPQKQSKGCPALVKYTRSQEAKRPRYAAGSRAGDQSCIYEAFCVVCC